ncbi:MAG: HlyD family efflux transporter periplasmic adaptor subunit [Gemmatimonadetes bacterium]|nr:HlyD family efflux transporter periplasmic adaptor subunit [Gemmatimonadota bacterium]
MEHPKDEAEATPTGMTRDRVRPRVVEGNERRRLSLKKDQGRGPGAGSGSGGDPVSDSRVSRMDIKRAPKGKKKRNIYIGLGVVALLVVTFLLSQLEPAAPTVDRNVIVQGTVERGEMVREVRGSGTLVPERVQFVAAVTAGRVESVHFEPGQVVDAEDILVVLSNPDVELQVLEAEQQWTAARATLVSLRENLGSGVLSQQAAVADARARFREAERQAEAYASMVDNEWVSEDEFQNAQDNASSLQERLRTETARLDLLNETIDERLAVQRDQVARLANINRYYQERAANMQVRAGAEGVLQDFDLEVGQWVQSGTTLARVARPERLKAELRIPQTQARDVQVGQLAFIDTRTDTIPGRVRRVDPNVQGGSVLVEVTLEGDLPAGARPDLNIDGTVELERLSDVLHVGRPAYGQSHSTVSLFRVIENGNGAERVTVQLGRSSVNQIEVVEGLREDDVIILSDMSRYDDADRVRIR